MFPMKLLEFLSWIPVFLCSGILIGMGIVVLLNRPVDKAIDDLLKTIDWYLDNKF